MKPVERPYQTHIVNSHHWQKFHGLFQHEDILKVFNWRDLALGLIFVQGLIVM